MAGKKKFLVDVFRTYAYSVCVDAEDESEAKRLVERAEADGRFDPADFHETGDREIKVYGEVENDGSRLWPELEAK